MEELCAGCGRDVSENKKNRRLLSSTSCQHVFSQLCTVLQSIVEQRSTQLIVQLSRAKYVCKSCYRELEKHLKLQQKVRLSKEKLIANAHKALPSLVCTTEETSPKQSVSAHSCVTNTVRKSNRGPDSVTATSPPVRVTVSHKKKTKSFVITPQRRNIIKPLANRSHCSAARQCLKHVKVRKYIIAGIGRILKKEVACLCSEASASQLQDKTCATLNSFTWENVLGEFQSKSPTLLYLLQCCTSTRKPRKNKNGIIAFVISLLCRHRRRKFSLVQQVITLILYSGHASKKVYARLQKLHLCLSHKQTIALIDKLGVGYDRKVLEWKEAIESHIVLARIQNLSASGLNPEATHVDDDLHGLSLQGASSSPNSSTESSKDDFPTTSTPIKPGNPHLQSSESSLSPALSMSSPDSSHPSEFELSSLYLSEQDLDKFDKNNDTPCDPTQLDPCIPSQEFVTTSQQLVTPTSRRRSLTPRRHECLTPTSHTPSRRRSLRSSRHRSLTPTSHTLSRRASLTPRRHRSLTPTCHTLSRDVSLTPSRQKPDKASQPEPLEASTYTGYKLVFDNIDKTVRPRQMRIDSQTQSLHYVQLYAVKDRVDFLNVSPSPHQSVSSEVNLQVILPTSEDDSAMLDNFSVLVARIIVEHIPFFTEDFKNLIPKHIQHKYSAEMSKKSDVVPLGVLPKNEMFYEDMIDILDHCQTYVPVKDVTREVYVPGREAVQLDDQECYTILLGGDQLSVARARGAQKIRSNSATKRDRLDGLLPVAEDWHAKLCLLEVIWKRLYKTSSAMEKGTLFNLRNLINRRNVVKKCKQNVNATEDFLEVVVVGYVVSAVLEYLKMSSIDDLPSRDIIPDVEMVWTEDDSKRSQILSSIATDVVKQHIDLTMQPQMHFPAEDEEASQSGEQPNINIKPTSSVHSDNGDKDNILAYSREVLTLGLLHAEFKDSIKEGDGDRVLRIWKYLLLLFKASKRKNYAIEAFNILVQYHLVLPPQIAEQLKWSRFINTHGYPGKNISCDLHLEHMNKLLKTAIEGLGPNKGKKAIIRAGRMIGTLSDALFKFDEDNCVSSVSGAHTNKSADKDLNQILKHLSAMKVFQNIPSRKHRSFSTLQDGFIKSVEPKKLNDWILTCYVDRYL